MRKQSKKKLGEKSQAAPALESASSSEHEFDDDTSHLSLSAYIAGSPEPPDLILRNQGYYTRKSEK